MEVRGQRAGLVLSTVWVLGVKLRLSALAVSSLTNWSSSLALLLPFSLSGIEAGVYYLLFEETGGRSLRSSWEWCGMDGWEVQGRTGLWGKWPWKVDEVREVGVGPGQSRECTPTSGNSTGEACGCVQVWSRTGKASWVSEWEREWDIPFSLLRLPLNGWVLNSGALNRRCPHPPV